MTSPFGETRTHIAWNHAMIGPDSHVPALPPHWGDSEGVVLISPAMRAGGGGPRFTQLLVKGGDACKTTAPPTGVQRLFYVLQGEATLDGETIPTDGFCFLPADEPHVLTSGDGGELLVFEKRYQPLDGVEKPTRIVGTMQDSPVEPFLGDPDAMLTTLLPTDTQFDMAVNVFNFKPGASLPLVETHIMEHGLLMRSGQGVYRLGESWYPVQAGDAIWMASYCPQWFVAMGKAPVSYVYYKDVNRDPLEVS